MSDNVFAHPRTQRLDGPGIARVLAYAHQVGFDWTGDVVASLTDSVGRGLLTIVERPGDTPLRRALIDGVCRQLIAVRSARAARDLAHLRWAPSFHAECARRVAAHLAPRITPEEQEQLAEIRARPHDDAPRLAHAAWLRGRATPEEQARGELIAAEVELASRLPDDPARAALHRRAVELRQDHFCLWSRWFGGPPLDWDRGVPIVDADVASDHPWVMGVAMASARSPAGYCALSLGEHCAREVLASRELGPVSWLRIPMSAAIALPDRMRSLRTLELRGGVANWLNGASPTIAAIEAPALRALVIEVEWPAKMHSMSFVETLAGWPALAGLRRLAILGARGLETAHALQLCAAVAGELAVDFAGSEVDVAELASGTGGRVRADSVPSFSWYTERGRDPIATHRGFAGELRDKPEARLDVIAWIESSL